MDVKKGQIVTLKPEYLEPGELNAPHIALEDSWRGSVKVEILGDVPGLRFKPVNDWRLAWIAEPDLWGDYAAERVEQMGVE